jgi:ribosomal protein S18 acetylase RimI-like enzyme
VELTWQHEASPSWDADKRRVIGSAPAGVFDLHFREGQPLPGDWWVATAEGRVVGYGWLDATWGGDAEILLAVDATTRQQGVGSFVLSHLEDEAAARGLNYVYNTVRETHPGRDDLHDWLAVRGYRGGTSDTTLRKRVGADRQREAVGPDPSMVPPAASRPAAGGAGGDAVPGATGGTPYDPAGEGERAPGHEESGGYVDVDDHRY